MLKLTCIGNLGADAELHNENGNEFVSFKVAHSESFRDSQGNKQERTQWVSCTLNGRAEKLLPYLVKGQKVAVYGDQAVRTYHSEKQRALVAGINCFVRSIELVGGAPDPVPRTLYDRDGIAHAVERLYACPDYYQSTECGTLFSTSGEVFALREHGFVMPTHVETQTDGTGAPAAANVPSEDNKQSNSNMKESK